MRRLTIWLVCCAGVTAAIVFGVTAAVAFGARGVNVSYLTMCAFYALMGAPLLAHYLINKE